MSDDFGRKVTVAGLAVTGDISLLHDSSIPTIIKLAEEIVACIGMHTSHPAQITDYPVDPETGVSPGFLILQPIYESAVLIDVWPPLSAAYIHVVSCKSFAVEPIWELLIERGYTITDNLEGELET